MSTPLGSYLAVTFSDQMVISRKLLEAFPAVPEDRIFDHFPIGEGDEKITFLVAGRLKNRNKAIALCHIGAAVPINENDFTIIDVIVAKALNSRVVQVVSSNQRHGGVLVVQVRIGYASYGNLEASFKDICFNDAIAVLIAVLFAVGDEVFSVGTFCHFAELLPAHFLISGIIPVAEGHIEVVVAEVVGFEDVDTGPGVGHHIEVSIMNIRYR